MPTPSSPTLHAVNAATVGEFTMLAIAERARAPHPGLGLEHGPAHDPVLVLGPARAARNVSQLLGGPVHSAPIPRVGTMRSIAKTIERTAMALGASGVIGYGLPDLGECRIPFEHAPSNQPTPAGFGVLPTRADARRALGLGDACVLAPLADRPEQIDARTIMFITGVIEIIGESLAIVLPARARRLGEALAYHRGAGLHTPVRIVDGAWLHALPAADLCVEPIDAESEHRPAWATARALADHLHLPVATTAAWHLDPDAATNSLPAEIRATVAPVLASVRARSGSDRAATGRPATVPA